MYAKKAKNTFYSYRNKKPVMGIRYYEAPDVKQLADTIIKQLGFTHIDTKHIYCFRSRGSKSKRTVARVHSLERLWQLALKTHSRYLIEVIAERYDRLSPHDQEKVVIHELLHIPKKFGGGFRPHKGYINQKTIDKLHEILERQKLTGI